MRLLYLHGAPASGKRTVGEAVDAPGFWDLVHAARLIALDKAAEHRVPLVIYTSCYSHAEDLPLLEAFERVLTRHGGVLLPVFLTCPRRTLEERIGAADRVERRKVTSKEGLDRCLSKWNLVPVPRPNCYTVDTEMATPAEAARDIVRHFELLSR